MGPQPGVFDKIRGWVQGRRGHRSLPFQTWTGAVERHGSVMDCHYVVFDTELTGLNPRKDSIISIGAIGMTGPAIHGGEVFYSLVRPEGKMPDKTVTIHNITPDEVREAPDIDAVMARFSEFIKDAVLVGHFLHLDLRFVNKYLKRRYGVSLKNPALDTHNIHDWLNENGSAFRKHYRGTCPRGDLFTSAKWYGIEVDAAHNALTDAFITAQLFQRFLHFLGPSGIHSLGELMDIGRA